MSIVVKKVENRRQLRKFVVFAEKLYRKNPYYVPAIVFDEMDTLDPARNPASEFSDFELYLAYKDGKIAGRVAAIINYKANETWKHNEVRFGWIDFIDDPEVAAALLSAVEDYGKAHGMTEIAGPLGFTDFDPEGLLIEGFDQLGTMPIRYSYPYYKEHIEALGFKKDADWFEFRLTIPDGQIPDKITRVANIVRSRGGYRVRQLDRRMIKREDYAHKLFHLMGETYKDLYEYTVLPTNLADKYIGFYLTFLDLRYVSVVENEKGELIAFGITMPSIARALQKSRGRLLPFGWWPLLKDLLIKHTDGAELMLIGVHPDYRNSGVNALLMEDILVKFQKMGVKWADSNAQLETNLPIQNQFEVFKPVKNKVRRSYKKKIK